MKNSVPSPADIALPTLLGIADDEIGTRESNNNSGKRVQEYQEATTLGGTHWPWCAAFVAWCLLQTAKKLGIKIPWSNSASCDVILADAKARGLVRTVPKPGYIFLVRARLRNGTYSKTDMIHTGIVEKVCPDGSFTEISGNTNDDGGREGVAVLRSPTPRKNNGRYYFVAALEGIEGPLPAASSWKAYVRVPQGSDGSVIRALPSKLVSGRLLVPIRAFGEATGRAVEFKVKRQVVTLDGQEIPFQRHIYDGDSYYFLTDLATFCNGAVARDANKQQACAVLPR